MRIELKCDDERRPPSEKRVYSKIHVIVFTHIMCAYLRLRKSITRALRMKRIEKDFFFFFLPVTVCSRGH